MESIPLNRSISRERGFTLIEIVVVVALIAFMAVAVVSRFNAISPYKQREQLRTFINTWQFLFRESLSRGEAYRLIIDLDQNSYRVLREVPQPREVIRQVDYLKNLRTKSEKKRRAEREEEELLSVDEEFAEDDARQGGALDALFYQFAYSDPYGNVRLSRPLEFPNLADPVQLPDELRFRDVKMQGDVIEEGRASIRFSPRGGSEFAVVHLKVGDDIFTVFMNPTSGELIARSGDLDFNWTAGQAKS